MKNEIQQKHYEKLNKLRLELDNNIAYVGTALSLFPNILPSLICADSNEPFLSYKIEDASDIDLLINSIQIDTAESTLKHGDNTIPYTILLSDDGGYEWKLKYTTIINDIPTKVFVTIPKPHTNNNISWITKHTSEGDRQYISNLHSVTYYGNKIVYYADEFNQDELLETVYNLYKYTKKGE